MATTEENFQFIPVQGFKVGCNGLGRRARFRAKRKRTSTAIRLRCVSHDQSRRESKVDSTNWTGVFRSIQGKFRSAAGLRPQQPSTRGPADGAGGQVLRASRYVVTSGFTRRIPILAVRSDGLRPRRPPTISAGASRINKRKFTTQNPSCGSGGDVVTARSAGIAAQAEQGEV